ncbi:hypothetical protein Tco_0426428, partial [Tanacetum coccineum]
MNSKASSGGSGDDGNGNDVGTCGGKCSDDGRGGNGGDSEMSGDGGGGGKARSLSTSSSDGKGIGVSGRIDILAVVRHVSGDGGVAAYSSVSNSFVSLEEGTWSTTGATTELAGARCSTSSSSQASSSSSSSSEESSSSS